MTTHFVTVLSLDHIVRSSYHFTLLRAKQATFIYKVDKKLKYETKVASWANFHFALENSNTENNQVTSRPARWHKGCVKKK